MTPKQKATEHAIKGLTPLIGGIPPLDAVLIAKVTSECIEIASTPPDLSDLYNDIGVSMRAYEIGAAKTMDIGRRGMLSLLCGEGYITLNNIKD